MKKRSKVIVGAAVLGGASAYAFSWVLRAAACDTGTCPVATVPIPLIVAFALVAGLAALSATREWTT